MLYKLLVSIERFGALIAVVVLSPLFVIVGCAIFCLSGLGPLVAHRRLGRFGVPFWMLKFRTMWDDPGAAEHSFIERLPDRKVPERKLGIDPRVSSRFAAFCRKHSLDELPQLLHVVRGEMSLVGPRPMTRAEWEKHYGAASAEVLNLRPGLSGLWQTRGRNRLTYRQRRRLDLFLARHYCLLLYMRILGQTVPRVIAGRDAC